MRGAQGHDSVGIGAQFFDAGAFEVLLEEEGGGARRAFDFARVVRDGVPTGEEPDSRDVSRDVEEEDLASGQLDAERPFPVGPDLLDAAAEKARRDLAQVRVEAEAVETQTMVTRESVARSWRARRSLSQNAGQMPMPRRATPRIPMTPRASDGRGPSDEPS